MAEDRPDKDRGFTLIETLVAMMVLAVSLGIIFQLFSGGLRIAGISEDYTRAVFLAREKMETVILAGSLAPGQESGEFEEGWEWEVGIEDAMVREEEPIKPVLETFSITVKVVWQDGPEKRDFTIRTITIAKRKPENEDF